MTSLERVQKRIVDVIGAALGLVLLSPVALATAVAVKLCSRGPILFRHQRVGREGKLFWMFKLRTMAHSSGELRTHVTTASDPRLLPIGRQLRRYRLDELPQLWNVLVGEMSLVGPRPDVPGYADRLEGSARRLLELRPGITGPGQLFSRNEEELLAEVDDAVGFNDHVMYPEKTRLNLEYLDSWSLARDFGYIAVTICPPCDRWLHLTPPQIRDLEEYGYPRRRSR